ncbi:ATP-dependent metallopeptidase FtsH/Yme1/Tma family protein [Candidatus Daviesbacteria bacterium]|nr:ATP-dependent metallopeptidase FtsH/Yme1/Tma family protein [Candidatus Daviesbacteria bacterium]
MPNGKRKINVGKKIFPVFKGLIVYVLIALAALIFFYQISGGPSTSSNDVPISQIIQDTKDGKIQKITLEGDKVTAEVKDSDQKLSSRKEEGESIYKILESSGVDPKSVTIEVKDLSLQQAWVGVLSAVLPILILVGLMFLLFRNAREGAQGIFSFAQSRARLYSKDQPQIKFTDVAGAEEAKKELSEIVEFLKTPEKFKALGARIPKGVLMVGPAGTGKCVTGDTVIWTNKGLMEIREVPRYFFVDPKSHEVYGAQLSGLNPDDVVSSKNFASHWFNLGEQETIRVKLAQGFTLEGTPEHPVVVMDKDGKLRFRNLQQIQQDDYVAIQFGRRMFGDLNLVDQDTAYLLGLLTGDGNLSHASRVGLTSIEPEIIEFYKKYIKTHYPKCAISTSINGQSFLVSNWDLKRQLYQLGMSYLLSYDKVIPPTVLQAPEAIQVSFLQGLFDTDACIGTNQAEFEYTTVSEKMARQVQMMLLNLGTVASLNIKGRPENGYYRSVYRLTMTGSSLVNFSKVVGFRLSRKQKLLKAHTARMERVNTNIDIVPGIAHLVYESWRKISENKLSNEKLSKIIDKVRRRGRVSRQTLSEYVSFANTLDLNIPHLEYFRNILEAGLFFSKVTEKTSGVDQVYDFTVPQTHSFLGNGFVNHNTLLSRAIAGEAGVPFFSIAGSEFMEMLVGVGAARVRDMFAQAKKAAPAIIFVDEVESIGRQRGMGMTGGHDEREQTLNQILVEMDGFTPNDHVIVLAATNRPDLLDAALIRPGRFDRRVVLGMPDLNERRAIIELHMKGKPFTKEVSTEKLARRTVGFSGADLANMLNEAAILAAREGKTAIDNKDLEEAATKEKLGPQRKRMQSERDRKLAAYHEAGHAVVGHFLPNVDPVHRISIVSRGMSGGHTLFPPTEDRSNESKSRLMEQITAALGGQAAEFFVFKDISTGAASDIEAATGIARAMVTEYGMSSLGPLSVHSRPMFGIWRGAGEGTELSPKMHDAVDSEIKKIIDTCFKDAQDILRKQKLKLDKVAKALLEKETLESDEFEDIVGKKKINSL